jgi:arylsulfatase A-like enzyme
MFTRKWVYLTFFAFLLITLAGTLYLLNVSQGENESLRINDSLRKNIGLQGNDTRQGDISMLKTDYQCINCNVILIVMDATRFDHIGYAGYYRNTTPNVDKLAAESYFFTNAISAAPWTNPSIAAVLTSEYPHVNRVKTQLDSLKNKTLTIVDILSDNKYFTIAAYNNPLLNSLFAINHKFNFILHSQMTAKWQTDNLISKINATNKSFFVYVHYLEPHLPYEPPPEYRAYVNPNYTGIFNSGNYFVENMDSVIAAFRNGTFTQQDRQHMIDLYDGEILYTDEEIGRIFAFLREAGIWNNTIVIITADHGEGFFEHGRISHSRDLYNELLHVPLIIHIPAVGSGIVEHSVCLTDLAPTVLDILNISKPVSFEGSSVIPAIYSKNWLHLCYSEAVLTDPGEPYYDKKSVQSNRWKLILNTNNNSSELYDLSSDSWEHKNVVNDYPDVASELNMSLLTWMNTKTVSDNTTAVMEPNSELKKQLKALGYAI